MENKIIPKDIPKELRGLWKIQYYPLELKLMNGVTKPIKLKWDRLRYIRKMEIIDNLKKQGKI